MHYNYSMDSLQNLIEYYDELYPVRNEQKNFFKMVLNNYQMPAKILRIGCATGGFEHYLARLGHDVTGIDTSPNLVDSAALRRKQPNTAIRFFHMTPTEMTHFLGKKFYNIITSLEGSLYFIHDETLRRKFFYDCHTLLADNGCLIIHLPDLCETRESPRISLQSKIECVGHMPEEEVYTLTQEIVRGDGQRISVHMATKIAQPTCSEIEHTALEAGFTNIESFSCYGAKSLSDNKVATLFVMK